MDTSDNNRREVEICGTANVDFFFFYHEDKFKFLDSTHVF